MHTFEVNCNVCAAAYHYLHEHLPSLVQVSEFVERTNFYSGKGIMQIELRRYEYAKYGYDTKILSCASVQCINYHGRQ